MSGVYKWSPNLGWLWLCMIELLSGPNKLYDSLREVRRRDVRPLIGFFSLGFLHAEGRPWRHDIIHPAYPDPPSRFQRNRPQRWIGGTSEGWLWPRVRFFTRASGGGILGRVVTGCAACCSKPNRDKLACATRAVAAGSWKKHGDLETSSAAADSAAWLPAGNILSSVGFG